MKLEPQKIQTAGDNGPQEKNWREVVAIVFVFAGVFYWVIKIVF